MVLKATKWEICDGKMMVLTFHFVTRFQGNRIQSGYKEVCCARLEEVLFYLFSIILSSSVIKTRVKQPSDS